MDSPHYVAGKKQKKSTKKKPASKKPAPKKGSRKGKGIFKTLLHGAVDAVGDVVGLGKKKRGGEAANVVAGAKKAMKKMAKDNKTEKKKLEDRLKKVEKERKKVEMMAKKEIEAAKKKLEKVAEKLAKAARA